MGGSDERPVSSAKMCGVRSPKHSSTVSKPDLEPSMENHGVQMWAGMRWQRGSISSDDLEQVARVQAEDRAPVGADVADAFEPWPGASATASSVGAKTTLCTLRVGAVALVDVADLAGEHEAHLRRGRRRGTSAGTAAASSGLRRKRPSSAGSSLSRISCSQPGWAMSPVPTMCTPLSCAQRAGARSQVLAGGAGIMGVDVEIGDELHGAGWWLTD